MLLEFTKMSGAGNDFVFIDNRAQKISLTGKQIAQLGHRHFGIGFDGLGLLIPCASGKADWAWRFYNSDGSEAEMCGNGSRCFARYIQRLTGAKDGLTFETLAGVITAKFLPGKRVTVNLTSPKGLRLNETVQLSTGPATVHFLNTGVEHAVIFVPDVEKTLINVTGSEIRYHKHFAPKGTNANFVQILGPNHIRVRTYERGVEGETLACGTGVTASSLITSKIHNFKSPIKVQVQGGDELEVSFDTNGDQFSNVCLTGPGEFVFEGKIEV